ncbi:MAG: pyridoxal 5'-phosphate synthase glutaminase subunit PdxT [Miltoncostaeaceae bacterium]
MLSRPRVGVLAVQGAFAEHERVLSACGAQPVQVRTGAGLDGLDGLVIPGGESTTLGLVAGGSGLLDALRAAVADGLPVLGTCAGMIVLARDTTGGPQPLIGGIDITVRRNAFGRQRSSFEARVPMPVLGGPPVDAVFIRAPWIERAGPAVEVLAHHAGHGVAARQGHLMVTAFHPELADEPRFHEWLVERAREHDPRPAGVERREGHVRAQ